MISLRTTTAHRKSAGAFSLIEVAIAIGVFAFAIVGILALFPVAMQSARESRDETIVVNIARMVMSELRASPFNAARVVALRNPANDDNMVWEDKEVRTINLGANANDIAVGYRLVAVSNGTQRWNPVGVVSENLPPTDPPPAPLTQAGSSDYTVRIQTARLNTNPAVARVTVTVQSAGAAGSYPFTVLVSENQP